MGCKDIGPFILSRLSTPTWQTRWLRICHKSGRFRTDPGGTGVIGGWAQSVWEQTSTKWSTCLPWFCLRKQTSCDIVPLLSVTCCHGRIRSTVSESLARFPCKCQAALHYFSFSPKPIPLLFILDHRRGIERNHRQLIVYNSFKTYSVHHELMVDGDPKILQTLKQLTKTRGFLRNEETRAVTALEKTRQPIRTWSIPRGIAGSSSFTLFTICAFVSSYWYTKVRHASSSIALLYFSWTDGIMRSMCMCLLYMELRRWSGWSSDSAMMAGLCATMKPNEGFNPRMCVSWIWNSP